MPKFVIERTVPGAAKLGAAELQSFAQNACAALDSMGPDVHWIETFVTHDKLYCVFYAPDEQTLWQLAQQTECVADRISKVHATVNPEAAGRDPAHPSELRR